MGGLGTVIIYDLPDQQYHERPELSSTGARLILDSPARYRYWADNPQPPKAAFDLGHAAHAKILGVGASIVLYPDEHLTPSGNVSTKAATVEWERAQRARGLVPISRADAARVDAMAEAVLADRDARAVLESISGREVSVIADVDGVPSRARFDIHEGLDAADLKSARDASPHGFNRAIGTHRYHVQNRWYDDVQRAVTGERLNSFKFVVVETAPPHLVGVYDLDLMWEDAAAKAVEKARQRWRECTESGVWPGYGSATLTAPPWVVYEDEEIHA